MRSTSWMLTGAERALLPLLALGLSCTTLHDDRSTPERMLQTCFAALQRDDGAEQRRCYSPHWPWYAVLEGLAGSARADYDRYRREVLAGQRVELDLIKPDPGGNPDIIFIVPRYQLADGGVYEDAGLWTELRRVDGAWVIWAEHNDVFQGRRR